MLLVLAPMLLHALPQFDSFDVPGFSRPVSGVWHTAATLKSPLPLGALGTGFVELTASGAFGAASVENDWLKPRPVEPESGFVLRIGGRTVELLPGRAAVPGARFWGHFPCADLDFGAAFGPVTAYLRAYAPLVPHDYDVSALPAVFFKFIVTNTGQDSVPAAIVLQWKRHEVKADAEATDGGYAVGGSGPDWTVLRQESKDGLLAATAECA
ncbi:MAG TPA: GH116 family glycosyl-hydrolase, partial [Candidatus Hydrogenedentes bacterium]|nr:GH116 family glycosyl-hydrolase [Candidatus Hydrogenedentota bacterium]